MLFFIGKVPTACPFFLVSQLSGRLSIFVGLLFAGNEEEIKVQLQVVVDWLVFGVGNQVCQLVTYRQVSNGAGAECSGSGSRSRSRSGDRTRPLVEW